MSATAKANKLSARRHPAGEESTKTNFSSPGSRAPAPAQSANTSPSPPESRKRVCKRDVAREYRVSLRTVDKWIHERKIPFVKISERLIRFDLDAGRRSHQPLHHSGVWHE
jgi:hypothetical protein